MKWSREKLDGNEESTQRKKDGWRKEKREEETRRKERKERRFTEVVKAKMRKVREEIEDWR